MRIRRFNENKEDMKFSEQSNPNNDFDGLIKHLVDSCKDYCESIDSNKLYYDDEYQAIVNFNTSIENFKRAFTKEYFEDLKYLNIGYCISISHKFFDKLIGSDDPQDLNIKIFHDFCSDMNMLDETLKSCLSEFDERYKITFSIFKDSEGKSEIGIEIIDLENKIYVIK